MHRVSRTTRSKNLSQGSLRSNRNLYFGWTPSSLFRSTEPKTSPSMAADTLRTLPRIDLASRFGYSDNTAIVSRDRLESVRTSEIESKLFPWSDHGSLTRGYNLTYTLVVSVFRSCERVLVKWPARDHGETVQRRNGTKVHGNYRLASANCFFFPRTSIRRVYVSLNSCLRIRQGN